MEYLKTYHLIQQTPLIHFQHNQQGATLRASEVKPKLDKFIIRKMGDKIPKNWFIDDTQALNYKMRIVAQGEPQKSETIGTAIELKNEKDRLRRANERNSQQKRNLENKLRKEINEMYFGNMVSDNERDYVQKVEDTYKETVFYSNKIQLTVTCFIEELRNAIDTYIEEFFIVHNFGTRQSKGFGGFVISESEKAGKDPVTLLSEQGYNFFYVDINGSTTFEAMMNHAKNVYAMMKGGYNHTKFDNPDSYVKGYIQRDFIAEFYNEQTGSDKAYIKKHKSLTENEKKNNRYDSYLFTRALLGLADYYDFMRGTNEISGGKVDIFSLGEKSFDIERFKSPITIKIIGNQLLFIFGSFKEICGKEFYFAPNGIPNKNTFDKMSYKDKKTYIESNPDIFIKISTPKKFDNDDIIRFINLFAKYFENNKYKFNNFRNRDINMSKYLTIRIPSKLLRKEYRYD